MTELSCKHREANGYGAYEDVNVHAPLTTFMIFPLSSAVTAGRPVGKSTSSNSPFVLLPLIVLFLFSLPVAGSQVTFMRLYWLVAVSQTGA